MWSFPRDATLARYKLWFGVRVSVCPSVTNRYCVKTAKSLHVTLTVSRTVETHVKMLTTRKTHEPKTKTKDKDDFSLVWRVGVVVTSFVESVKLLYVEPG